MAEKPGDSPAVRAGKAVSRAKEKTEKTKTEQVVEMTTGVKLLCKKIPRWLYVDIMNELNTNRPKVPTYFDTTRGQDIENPDDPEYSDRLKSWHGETAGTFYNSLIIEGTEVYSLPKNFPDDENPDFLARMQAQKRPGLENPYTRYLYWVKYVAAPDDDVDINIIMEHVGALSGIREEDVEATLDSFPDKAARGADTED